MEEFCEGADRAVAVMAVFLAAMGVFHILMVAACLIFWVIDRLRGRKD